MAGIVAHGAKEIKDSFRDVSCANMDHMDRLDIAFVGPASMADLGPFFCRAWRFPRQHHGNRETEQ